MLFLSGISNIWWHCFAASTSNKKLIFIYIYIFMILWLADVKEKCCKCSWNGQFRVETTKCFNRCDSRYQGGVLRIDGKTPGFPLILTNDSSFARESAFHNQTSSSLQGMEMMKEKKHQKHICFFLQHSVHEIGCLVCLLIYFVRKCIVRRCGLKHVLKYTGLAKPSRNCRNWNKLHHDMRPINIENNM